MKTTYLQHGDPAWHVIDAQGQALGKVAVATATLLRGKHKASFAPHQLCGDHVVVINAAGLHFPGTKPMKKIYYKHTGYAGHLKSASLEEMMRRDPRRVVEIAVKGMLPRNKMRAQQLKRLHVFSEGEHKHEAQQPVPHSLVRP